MNPQVAIGGGWAEELGGAGNWLGKLGQWLSPRLASPALCQRTGGWTKALVVFSNNTELPWLRVLKPGFRHCFIALSDGEQWIMVEPLSHCTEISTYAEVDGFDMKDFYRSHGLRVIETELRRVPRQSAPWRFFTCVEGVKRVLGLHNPLILTPWQLYKFLWNEKKQDLNTNFSSQKEYYQIGRAHV